MTITSAKARSLCTKSELALVAASAPKVLPTFSVARLKQKIALARNLRDKWLAQSQQQRREQQSAQQSRVTEANARTDQKAVLFGEVLARFEKQLAKAEATGAAGSRPRRCAPASKTRSQQHRETRAAVRSAFQDQQEAIVLDRAAKKGVSGEQGDGKATATSKSAAPKKVVKKGSSGKKAAKKAVKKAAKKAVNKALPSASAPKPAAVKKKTLHAATAAKQSRAARGGKVRIQKHLSAQGRRSQSRRDSRG